jgi:integrase
MGGGIPVPEPYTLGRLHGKFVLVWRDSTTGRRRRYALGTVDAGEARRLAPAIFAELTRPKGKTVKELWDAYCTEKTGRAVVGTMRHTWRRVSGRFGGLAGDAVTVADSRAHIMERRASGIRDWTIYTELGHLRNVVRWAAKQGLIEKAPHIELPPQPKTEKRRLTREQVQALVQAATMPHIKLYIILLYSTAARTGALLDLTWDRVDLERGRVDLRNAQIKVPHKGRAIVPITGAAKQALVEAQRYAVSKYVIEWAGGPIKKARRALSSAARRAGLGNVNPHMLRHSAATHMAEAGVPMEEISQMLGHDDVNTTRKIYARFSPDYLRGAAGALEL